MERVERLCRASLTGLSGGPAEASAEAVSLLAKRLSLSLDWCQAAALLIVGATPVTYQLMKMLARRHRAALVDCAVNFQNEGTGNDDEGDEEDESGGSSLFRSCRVAPAVASGEVEGDNREDRGRSRGSSRRGSSIMSVRLSRGGGVTTEAAAAAAQGEGTALHVRVSASWRWMVAPFFTQVLALQRTPDRQFAEVCAGAAATQQLTVLLRLLAGVAAEAVSVQVIECALCAVLQRLLGAGGVVRVAAVPAAAAVPLGWLPWLCDLPRVFLRSPLLTTTGVDWTAEAPASPPQSVFALYVFITSAKTPVQRWLPWAAALDTLSRRLTCPQSPVLACWRRQDAAADVVWRSLTAKGYGVATCLYALHAQTVSAVRLGVTWTLRRWRRHRRGQQQHGGASGPAESTSSRPEGSRRRKSAQQAAARRGRPHQHPWWRLGGSSWSRLRAAHPHLTEWVVGLAPPIMVGAAVFAVVSVPQLAEGAGSAAMARTSALRLFQHTGGEQYSLFSLVYCGVAACRMVQWLASW